MKSINISSTYDWAMNYLAYCVKNGCLDESEIVGLSEKEIIDLANCLEAKADMAYDAWKDEQPN